MAFKIVNGKLVKITSQSDFGTPEQKRRGRRITGTLGNITRSPARPRRTSTPQEITRGPGPSIPAPIVPTISAGGNVQQAIAAQAPQTGGGGLAILPQALPGAILGLAPALGQGLESAFSSFGQSALTRSEFTLTPPSQTAPTSTATARGSAVSGLQQNLLNTQAQRGSAATGTLGLGLPRTVTDRTQLAVPALGGQIVTGGQLSQQNFFKTLNNPRTLGEFEHIGAGPQLQAIYNAYLNGERIDPVFLRFFWNQGLLEQAEDGSFSVSSAGNAAIALSGFGDGSRPPRFASSGLGLVNWRI